MNINSIINSLPFNLFDVILLLAFVIYVYEEYSLGLLASLNNLFSMIGSFILGLFIYHLLSQILMNNFSVSKGISDAISFFVSAAILYFILSNLISFLIKRSEVKVNRKYSKIGGAILGSISFFLVSAFLVSLLLSFPVASVIKSEIRDSLSGKFLFKNTQALELTTRQIFGGAISDTLNFMTIKPDTDSTVTLHFKTSNVSNDPLSEKEMLRLVNEERSKRGLSTLKFDEKLSEVGRKHAADMFKRGYFSHYTPEGRSPFDRLEGAGVSYLTAAENLAYAPEVELAHSGLMKSEGHRKNILDPSFNRIGIGVIDGGIYGKMFVQVFTD